MSPEKIVVGRQAFPFEMAPFRGQNATFRGEYILKMLPSMHASGKRRLSLG